MFSHRLSHTPHYRISRSRHKINHAVPVLRVFSLPLALSSPHSSRRRDTCRERPWILWNDVIGRPEDPRNVIRSHSRYEARRVSRVTHGPDESSRSISRTISQRRLAQSRATRAELARPVRRGRGKRRTRKRGRETEARLEAPELPRDRTYALSISSRTFHMFIMLPCHCATALSQRNDRLHPRRRGTLTTGSLSAARSLNVHQMFSVASDTHDGRAERHQAVAMLSLPRLHAPHRGHRCLP